MKLNWFGTLSAGQGYSGSSEQTALALERRDDMDVSVVSFNRVPAANVSEAGRKLKSKPFEKAEVAICHGFPVSFSSIQDYKYRVGYTMFETDVLPKGNSPWTGKFDHASQAINQQLDILLTPSEWCVQMFRDNGVTIPIKVVPNGINPAHFPYMERPEHDKFTFLQMATLSIRKNSGMVASAFMEVFKDKPDARLILKTQSGTHGHMEFMPSMGDIKIIDKLYTLKEIQDLMREADCFVFPSRGEGFGMPPLEAMATGLPVIGSNNTGMRDYMDPNWSYPVETLHKVPASHYPKKWGYIGNWFEPDYEQLKAHMLYVYEHRDEARQKGQLASQEVHANWNYDAVADKIAVAIADLMAGKLN